VSAGRRGAPAPAPALSLPKELDSGRLRRRALQVVALFVAVGLLAWLAPGLDSVRARLEHAEAGWLALGVALEVASCLCYVAMFRPVFCQSMALRTSAEIALAELGVGSLLPAGGLGGLALGVWALRRGGMPADQISTRSVAFFLIKCVANFVAVAVVGAVLWLGLGAPSLSPALTILPAALAVATMAAVAALPALLARARSERRAARGARGLARGVREALRLLGSGNPAILLGSLGYWAFDNVVLWACFHAFGVSPAFTVILMGYLIGQLGGLLPLPGGLGGVEGGLVGTLVVYGVSLTDAVAAVLAYRVIQFWIPLLLALPAFVGLQRGLNRPERPDLCAPAITT
jgi:uncharacterized membrane protein YbhN (UPF0104 family)